MATTLRVRGLSLLVLLAPALCCASKHGHPSNVPHKDSDQAMYRTLLDLRSDFVERIRKEGYKPSLTAPKIEMGDPPTFGNIVYRHLVEALDGGETTF